MCYKPEMRKWMSERLKRRKKEPQKAGTEPAPAPLQPAFYDIEPSQSEPPVEIADTTQATEPPDSAEEMPPSVAPSAQSTSGGSGDGNKRRRRRGRGGRGRSRSATPTAMKPTPSQEGMPATPVPATAVAVPAATPPESLRPSKGVVVLAIGLPGSGKSSWFKRHNITPLSSDLLRVILFDDPTEQRFQDLIFSNLRSMLKARLIARRPMNYVDATNLSPHERSGWIKLAKDYGYEVQAVFFDVPLEVCLVRNERRERKVPEEAMRRMAGKLKQPTFEEGFSKITVVKVKQKTDSDNSQ